MGATWTPGLLCLSLAQLSLMQSHCVLQRGKSDFAINLIEKVGNSLFALDWSKAFQVDVNALLYNNTPTSMPSPTDCNVIKNCDRDLQRVLDQYPAVFAPGLGPCTKVKARLLLYTRQDRRCHPSSSNRYQYHSVAWKPSTKNCVVSRIWV